MFDGYSGYVARSARTESNVRVKVTGGLLGWADVIFCMEKKSEKEYDFVGIDTGFSEWLNK